VKIRRDDASMLEMNDWIAELRDDGRAEPAADGGRKPETAAVAPPANRLNASVEASASVEANTSVEASAGVEASACAEVAERAPIGDQLRLPIAWCEMGSCISHHADPAALGEVDIRARAISAGWRVDALGRLACPQCQQSGPSFWASHPVALWDRDAAIARASLMAVAMRNYGRRRTIPGEPVSTSEWLTIQECTEEAYGPRNSRTHVYTPGSGLPQRD
jgi:hypothetical protein